MKNYARVWGRKFGRSGDDLDDYVADCLEECHRKVKRGKVRFTSTLYVVCRNVGISQRRKAARRVSLVLAGEAPSEAVTVPSGADDRPLIEQVRGWCPLLVELMEAETGGVPRDEIASRLGMSPAEFTERLEGLQARARERFGVSL